ncbi:aldehyde dehydrogenase [Coniophora puteana RWD-64-598 SS2]|uniref:Aldehyde dehydrogenase n=1 Tax=Coniophora puteana (strain RWD-64-598) TaxID=741705 RepID=A0A5M3MSE0_CONPW|nr:aldehyde dehydrogenase [Coniophora puteana RWD-64-598 SS2]EIW82078.1 aldehyde dehydrogenase [Coniophora puteana RWD-64-598 SS2]
MALALWSKHVPLRVYGIRNPYRPVCRGFQAQAQGPAPCQQAGDEFTVFNPANGQVLKTISIPSRDEINATLSRAHDVFLSGEWSNAPAITRSRVLSRLAQLLNEKLPSLAEIETMQTGRPIREMRTQLARLPEWLEYFAAMLRTRQGFVAPTQGKLLNYVQRIPLGVVLQVTPFNHPLLIALKKIAPALAAGNSVIVKPSELAPLTVLEFAELAREAGVPGDVLSVIPGPGPTIVDAIVSNPIVRKVDITAGTCTGRAIGAKVGANLASFTAELGGKAPILVFNDADITSAVNGAAFSAFVASGQTCVSGTRIIVQSGVYDEFMSRFLQKVESIGRRMGNPSNPHCSMGSVISPHHLKRIEDMLARKGNSKVLLGGHRLTGTSTLDGFDFSKGSFLAPTVINDVDVNHELWQEEIFGPVVVVKDFQDEQEGVALANSSQYGLGAGIWTKDLSRAHRVAENVNAGVVWVNTHHRNDPSSPWGGIKQGSGIGRENGLEAFEAYTQSKSVVINTAPPEESRKTDDWFSEGGEGKRYG